MRSFSLRLNTQSAIRVWSGRSRLDQRRAATTGRSSSRSTTRPRCCSHLRQDHTNFGRMRRHSRSCTTCRISLSSSGCGACVPDCGAPLPNCRWGACKQQACLIVGHACQIVGCPCQTLGGGLASLGLAKFYLPCLCLLQLCGLSSFLLLALLQCRLCGRSGE